MTKAILALIVALPTLAVAQASSSKRLKGFSAICRVTGVASSEKRVGWIRVSVNSCKARSAVDIAASRKCTPPNRRNAAGSRTPRRPGTLRLGARPR